MPDLVGAAGVALVKAAGSAASSDSNDAQTLIRRLLGPAVDEFGAALGRSAAYRTRNFGRIAEKAIAKAKTDKRDGTVPPRAAYSILATAEILCRLKDREPQPVRVLASQLVSVSPTRASRLVQDPIDAGYLQRGADQADGRISLISFTDEGRRYTAEVGRTFEDAVRKYFIDPLDDEDIAAITRIWGKLQPAAG
jgi:DNA-binding MarR family transcriptional regulator